jgi:hypothetical protein
MDTEIITEFENELRRMVGQPCWSAQISGVGSFISFNIGTKIKREQPLLNPDFKISDEERFFQGEFILYVEDCPWRIEGADKVLATWLGENTQDGEIDRAARQLVGHDVESVELARPGLDLIVKFDGGVTLRVFPDQIDADEGDNYSLALTDKAYVVAAGSTLYCE